MVMRDEPNAELRRKYHRLMKTPKKVLIFWDSRKVVMEVEILLAKC